MKKMLLSAMLLVMAVFVAACGGEKDSSSESGSKGTTGSLEQVKKDGVLKIGTEGTYAPFTYHDKSGKLTGYDVEVIEEVAKRLGVKAKFYETQWDALISGLDSKRFDVVANEIGITDERKEKYALSTPYARPSGVMVTHKDNKKIKTAEDAKGKKAAQTMTSNWGQTAKTYGAEIIQVQGFNESVELVASKRADLTFNDELSAIVYQKEKPNAPLKVVPIDTNNTTEIAFMTRKNQDDLVKEINKIIEDMRKDGTLKKISEKWFDKDVS